MLPLHLATCFKIPVQQFAINRQSETEYTKKLTCPHLHNSGIITWANEIAWVVPHQLAEGHLVTLLHSFPKFGRQVLCAWALETVGPLPVGGINLHAVWCGEAEESEGQAQAVKNSKYCLRQVCPVHPFVILFVLHEISGSIDLNNLEGKMHLTTRMIST